MFVEEKSKGEVPDFKLGTLHLSTAIRIGATRYPEIRGRFLELSGACCAVGAAAQVTGFVLETGMEGHCARALYAHLQAKFPRVPPDVMSIASGKHTGGMSREEVADWLEGQGY